MLHFAKWKTALILLVSVMGIAYASPNMFSKESLVGIPGWLPHNQLNLGLDLQGGAHMLLEIDTDTVVKERLETIVDDARNALRPRGGEYKIGYQNLKANAERNTVSVNIRKAEDLDEARSRLRGLATPLNDNLLTGVQGVQDIDVAQGAGKSIVITLTGEAIDQRIQSAVEQSIEIVRRRIDELGTTEPTIQRQGTDRILVQVPGLQDPKRLKDLLGQTAKLVFRMVDVTTSAQQAQATRAPSGSEVLNSADGTNTPYLVKKRILVSGENLVDAQPGFDHQTNEPIVSFRFDSTGATRFGRVTQRNVGRPFAIVLDDQVISAPVIREPILGGSGQISGGFTVQAANDLAILLRAGALPAPLTIIEERTVGPGLGADSVEAGKIASIIGLVAVVAFIIISYGLFGVFANIALAVNIALIVGMLSLLQATLTLPGIAGIVLTIGMAVDANVLIFERIREEIRAGKTPIASIEAGYSRALGTILDANITTFIAAVILFQLGSGPVRGFSVTLAIGIMTSVFTAFTVTRLMVAYWVRTRRPSTVPI